MGLDMRSFLILGLLTALAACGGGGGGGPVGGGGGSTGLIELSNGTTQGTSTIAGTMVDASNSIRTASASLEHQTRVLTSFTAGSVVFTDGDGDSGGTWSDGTSSLTESPNQSGTYSFAGIYNLASPSGSGPVILGVITPTANMPTTGTASYAGEGFINGSNVNTGSIATTSVSTVDANFATRLVDVTFSGFGTAQNFDELTITGASFDAARNTFAGGNLTLRSGGVDVTANILGSGITSDANGTFFGLNGAETRPDEVGGVFVADGTDGTLSGGYIAD